ncbi:MAG: cytochrome c oxidase subunit 3 [Alphaproteobacteria bacterium]|nr:cytochrome c oxidase subunit 3 [Alphaproteobacteria bacterium]
MADHKPNHDYHLVNPSPWPLLGAFSGFILALGFLAALHPGLLGAKPAGDNKLYGLLFSIIAMTPGIALVLTTFYCWWRDVIAEGKGGFHTAVVEKGLRLGMALFIASEIMFFVAFFWAFFHSSLFVDDIKSATRFATTGGIWPPKGITPIETFELPFVNTLILLLSGTTFTWAHHAIKENNRRDLVRGLGFTIILGLLFTCFQAYEYIHAPFAMKDGAYGSTFFMATGFHGLHVIIGSIFLTVCYLRAKRGHFTATHHFGLEAAGWYWHFVDVVWLFLFISIYWWGGSGA